MFKTKFKAKFTLEFLREQSRMGLGCHGSILQRETVVRTYRDVRTLSKRASLPQSASTHQDSREERQGIAYSGLNFLMRRCATQVELLCVLYKKIPLHPLGRLSRFHSITRNSSSHSRSWNRCLRWTLTKTAHSSAVFLEKLFGIPKYSRYFGISEFKTLISLKKWQLWSENIFFSITL